jgi:hypothetical protein
MRARVLAALAVADFRERARRPSYLVVLLAAVGLGYLAAPAVGAHWTIVNAGAFRGVYNSAYVGTVTALAGALWLSSGGFYVIRTAIARDRQTGVGELLAAAPMRDGDYLAGKFLSNLLVLGSMAGALAVTAVAMQLARGESRAVDPVGLLAPFVLCTVPVLAMTAAAAVVFETTPVLRGGLGNVIWLFGSLAAAIAGQSANAPLGGLGVGVFAESLRDQFAAHGVRISDLALGLMYLDDPPRTVPWSGIDFTVAFAGQRLLLIVVAAATAIVPALWFDRFDRARTAATPQSAPPLPAPSSLGHQAPPFAPGEPTPPLAAGQPTFAAGRPTQPFRAGQPTAALAQGPPTPALAQGPPTPAQGPPAFGRAQGASPHLDGRPSVASMVEAGSGAATSLASVVGDVWPAGGGLAARSSRGALTPRRRAGVARLVRGELRILTAGVSRWWWLVALGLVLAGVAAPVAARPLLVAAWIWPVLVWSRLGAQARELGAEGLLDAYPSPGLRTLAQWLAGAVFTAVLGVGPGVAMAVHGQFGDWLAGVTFIPALALALGVISRTQRFFQAVYPLLWYMVVNDVAGLDYMGVLNGGPSPLTVAAVALLMLACALVTVAVRHRRR